MIFVGRLKRENEALRKVVSLQASMDSVFDTLDIHGTPSADRLSRSETNHVPGFIDALAYAINPTVAQRMVDRFRPG